MKYDFAKAGIETCILREGLKQFASVIASLPNLLLSVSLSTFLSG